MLCTLIYSISRQTSIIIPTYVTIEVYELVKHELILLSNAVPLILVQLIDVQDTLLTLNIVQNKFKIVL